MAEKHRIRTKQFLINLSDDEMQVLEAKAAKYHMRKTDLVRNMILFGESKRKGYEHFSRKDAETLRHELNCIGDNVNQIAYEANSKLGVRESEYAKLKHEFDHLLTLFETWAIE